MGIKRCPYCRALISEEDQYCRNCGTQLLFPEDENIEEEIPGDKIIDLTDEKTSDQDDYFPSAEDEIEEEEDEVEVAEGIREMWIELDEEEDEEETEEVIIVDEDNLNLPQNDRLETMADINREKEKKKEKTPAELLFQGENTPLLFPEENLTDIINADSEVDRAEKQVVDENITKKVERLKEEILAKDESRDRPDEQRPGFVTMAMENLKNEIERELEKEEESVLQERKGAGLVTEIIQELERTERKGKTGQSDERSKEYDSGVETLREKILASDESRERRDERRPGFVTMAVESLKNEMEGESEEESVLQEKKSPGPVTEIIQKLKRTETGDKIEQSEEKTEEYDGVEEITTFSTAELDDIGPTVDLGRRQVEDFFELLENKAKESKESSGSGDKKVQSEETGEFPAWLKEVRDESFEQMTAEKSETEEETVFDEETSGEEIKEKPVGHTIGFPESLTRDSGYFESSDQEAEEEFYPGEEVEDEGGLEISDEKKRPSRIEPQTADNAGYQIEESESIFSTLGFKNYIKAKMFDLFFIGLFWLVSIWLAARSLNSTIFRLLEVATTGLLIYLLILTVSYFFLFYFFIGETIGDRLFKEGDGEESDF